jgi:hypothetical protein
VAADPRKQPQLYRAVLTATSHYRFTRPLQNSRKDKGKSIYIMYICVCKNVIFEDI